MLESVGPGGELALIQQVRNRSPARRGPLRLGIGDDCAILRPLPGHELLVTTDLSLEGRHFRRDWHPAAAAGHRCLARGLSDIAAMGGTPLACFLSLALPGHFRSTAAGRRWIDGFLDGLLALAANAKTPLAGGDTSSSPCDAILADIVLMGSAPAGSPLRRSGARPGDGLYVTGALGGAAAELQNLSQTPKQFRNAHPGSNHPHLFPLPRLRQGNTLRASGLASAAIDVSDGLSTDLRHLCEASGVGAVVEAAALPLHPLLTELSQPQALQLALHGGEDYELLFTARPTARIPRRIGRVPLTRIGTITRGSGIFLSNAGKQTSLRAQGWEHTV